MIVIFIPICKKQISEIYTVPFLLICIYKEETRWKYSTLTFSSPFKILILKHLGKCPHVAKLFVRNWSETFDLIFQCVCFEQMQQCILHLGFYRFFNKFIFVSSTLLNTFDQRLFNEAIYTFHLRQFVSLALLINLL